MYMTETSDKLYRAIKIKFMLRIFMKEEFHSIRVLIFQLYCTHNVQSKIVLEVLLSEVRSYLSSALIK